MEARGWRDRGYFVTALSSPAKALTSPPRLAVIADTCHAPWAPTNREANRLGTREGRGFVCGLHRQVPQLAKRVAQLCGTVDHDAPSRAEQHGREHFQPIAPAAQTRAALLRLRGHSPWGKGAFGFLDRHVDPNVDPVVRLDERHAVLQIGARIETGGTAERGCAKLQVRHALKAEGAQRPSRQAMADQVPAPV